MELLFLNQLLHCVEIDYHWIGLKKIANNSSFVYDFDNKKVVWTNWDLNEPNGALVGEGCVHMATNMKWNDNNCLRKFNFICEKI